MYAKVPGLGPLVAGEHLVYVPAPTIDLDAPLRGGFLTKTLLLSPEPFMRERLRDPAILTYSTPMVVGQPLVGFGLVQVLRSEKEGVKAGDYMYGFTPWERYTVQPYVDARFDFASVDYPSYTVDMDTLVLQPVLGPLGAFPWSEHGVHQRIQTFYARAHPSAIRIPTACYPRHIPRVYRRLALGVDVDTHVVDAEDSGLRLSRGCGPVKVPACYRPTPPSTIHVCGLAPSKSTVAFSDAQTSLAAAAAAAVTVLVREKVEARRYRYRKAGSGIGVDAARDRRDES
uniref:Oxidoreductase N-terminal domain-containing protein n=1 Tax=Mycena chlorophos TaxID=658473 RepID=A0ABQ0LEW1_MYCCL|nr:predicted protein [Mycena chlorophos]